MEDAIPFRHLLLLEAEATVLGLLVADPNRIHQAVEAKEGVELSDDGGQAARITVQEFFLRYPHLAGMSGTARSSTRELRRIYRLRVAAVPTNRPPIRKRLASRILGTEAAKWGAVVAEV